MHVIGRVARRAGALGGAAALAVLVGAVPASAHETSLSVGANTATVTADHGHVTVCDNEDDGRAVFAEFAGHPLGGTPHLYPDAYGGGCTTYALDTLWGSLWGLCEAYGGCDFTFI